MSIQALIDILFSVIAPGKKFAISFWIQTNVNKTISQKIPIFTESIFAFYKNRDFIIYLYVFFQGVFYVLLLSYQQWSEPLRNPCREWS